MPQNLPLPYAPDPLVKQPTERWPFTMPFIRLLQGQVIAEVTAVRVYRGTFPTDPKTEQFGDPTNPPEVTDLKLEETDFDVAGLVEVTLSGGVHGEDYYLEIDVTTTEDNVRSADGWLLVRDQVDA